MSSRCADAHVAHLAYTPAHHAAPYRPAISNHLTTCMRKPSNRQASRRASLRWQTAVRICVCNSCMCLQVFPNASISSEAAEDPPTVTVVTTAEQLHAAVWRAAPVTAEYHAGGGHAAVMHAAVTGAARHIELQSHLNLLSLHITESSLLGDVFSATRTLRVRPNARHPHRYCASSAR